MNFKDFGIVCPICKGDIVTLNDAFSCPACHHIFPNILGIPDLRYPPADSNQIVESMLEKYEHASFEDLITILLSNAKLTDKIIENTLTYYNHQGERTKNMTEMFFEKLKITYGEPASFRALDLGCGSGAGIIALSNQFQQVVGIDSSLAQLLLAKKYLGGFSIKNHLLISANAEYLPVKNQNFSYIQAINVFEHIINLKPVIREISRCLYDKGFLLADSRNRFDIFFPEPHTGIRFLGFLPRKLIPKYVHYRCDCDYEKTQLLSYKEIIKLMNDNFIGYFNITYPRVASYGKPAWLDQWITIITKIPIIRNIIIRMFTTHIIIGQKQLKMEQR